MTGAAVFPPPGLRRRSWRASALRCTLAAWIVICLAVRTAEPLPALPKSEPLLLGEALDSDSPKGPVADNSRCFVCHANYDFNEEKLVFQHAKVNIGCVRCHGQSSPHSTDENGLTAPDRMYPAPHVRFNCLGCHDSVKLVASDQTKVQRADLKEKPDHQAVLDGRNKEKPYCTDCHGEHRLGHRTRKWDKRTGKLVYRDATPDMLPAGGASK